jgi:hypothetical protein
MMVVETILENACAMPVAVLVQGRNTSPTVTRGADMERDPKMLETELVQIYRDYGFMSVGSESLDEWNCNRKDQGLMPVTVEATTHFDNDNENIRVREIGVMLNDIGGHRLMAKVATNVVNALGLGSIVEREFDAVWDGIGTWRF